MKKNLSTFFIAFGLVFSLNAQVQRMQIFEEFSGENCAPCAAVNPYVNSLMNANTDKIILLKYQVPIPSAGPLYTNTVGKTDVDARLSYYGVNSAPDGYQDGNVFGDHPGNFTQAMIDNRASVSSPLAINLKHRYSDNKDSIYVTMVVKASQAVAANLKARIAVIEKGMYYTTAPGSNGEKEFHHVVKKMLPNAAGTTLAALAADDSVVIEQAWKFSQIRDMAEVAVVGFVQNDGNKAIIQSAMSDALPIPINLALSSINFGSFLKCDNNVSGSVVIKNEGETTITSALVIVKVNTAANDTLLFNGSLEYNESTTFNIPLSLSNEGLYTISITVDKPNGQTDPSFFKNKLTTTFYKVNNYSEAPHHQTFQTTTFPNLNWFVYNPDSGPTWTRRSSNNATTGGGFGLSTACAKMDYYNSTSGNIDELFMAPMNLSTIANTPNLSFSIAHARYNNTTFDRLEVHVSTDCGANWETVWGKEGAALATTASTTGTYVPTASHWRAETVDMSDYLGFSEVFIKFKAISDYGNNLYLDDVKLNDFLVSAKNTELKAEFSVYPNPAKDEFVVTFSEAKKHTIALYNTFGQLVKTVENSGNETQIITSELSAGLYTYQISTENGALKVGKINIIK